MRALSQDLRERIIAAVDHREGSRREIARRFRVDVSCITRLLQLRATRN
jgi:transposase